MYSTFSIPIIYRDASKNEFLEIPLTEKQNNLLLVFKRFFDIFSGFDIYRMELNKLIHTLVVVRLIWQKGAIYRFFWRRYEDFLSEEKMDMAFCLEFCFFVSRQRKNKNDTDSYLYHYFCRKTI